MVSQIKEMLWVLTMSLALGGCYIEPQRCTERDPVDDAASYRWLGGAVRYSEPLNTWVKNERLEAILLKAYREGGLAVLKSRYGLDCAPRTVTPPCDSCFTCRRTIAKTQEESLTLPCQIGEMSIEADIGPDWTVSAMTYWKRPPLTPAK